MSKRLLLSVVAAATFAFAQAPDNTKTNKRDDQPRAVTPEDQSNSKEDLAITQKIRQDLTDDKSLSTYGKNVKVITRDGATVLRGPVRSDEEKNLIEKIAEKHAGAGKVKSFLEVTR